MIFIGEDHAFQVTVIPRDHYQFDEDGGEHIVPICEGRNDCDCDRVKDPGDLTPEQLDVLMDLVEDAVFQ